MHAPLSSVSLVGEIDQARDMVMPGAFAQTLKARGLRKTPMLFQHDPAGPIGIWLELRVFAAVGAQPVDPGRDACA